MAGKVSPAEAWQPRAVLDRAFSALAFILPPVGPFLIGAGYVLLQP